MGERIFGNNFPKKGSNLKLKWINHIMILGSFFSNEPQHLGSSRMVPNGASWGRGGADACPSPQMVSPCYRKAQLHCPCHLWPPPLPPGPWQPQSTGPMTQEQDWAAGMRFAASPLTPAGQCERWALQRGRVEEGYPGLEDGGGSGNDSTGGMQRGIWDMQRRVYKHQQCTVNRDNKSKQHNSGWHGENHILI